VSLVDRLARFWSEARGSRTPQPPISHDPSGPEHDSAETLPPLSDETQPPVWHAGPITGVNLVIRYRDSAGATSERQITCRRLEHYSSGPVLHAWCALRRQPRVFKISRIAAAIDSATGEVFESGQALLDAFAVDLVSTGRFQFGLPPRIFADFHAALVVLAFIARSDGHWHELEEEAIQRFATAFWLRLDVMSDLDLQAVAFHVRRLSPDAESLWASVSRCAANPRIALLLERYLAEVIDADGIHHPQEAWWANEIATALHEAA